jgi:hypothetical protein
MKNYLEDYYPSQWDLEMDYIQQMEREEMEYDYENKLYLESLNLEQYFEDKKIMELQDAK